MQVDVMRSVRLQHSVQGKDIVCAFERFAETSPCENYPFPAYSFKIVHSSDVDGKLYQEIRLDHESGYSLYPVLDRGAENWRMALDEECTTFYVGVFNCETSQDFRPSFDQKELVTAVETVRDGLEKILNSPASNQA